MIKCTECGYENMDGLDYCDGCGAKLVPAAEGAGAAPAAAPATLASEHPAPEAVAAAGEAAATTTDEAQPAAEAPPASEVKTGDLTAPPAPAAGAGPAAAHFKAKLSLLRGGRKGQEFPLDSGQNFIGRWDPETGSFPEVDLEQDDPEAKISRKHALIIIDGSKITIEDIGSLNGTYVNRGNRLIPGTPLEIKAGDEVIIGKTFLKLVVDPIS